MAVEPFLGTRAQKSFVATIVVQAIIVLVMVAITFRFVEDAVDDLNDSQYKTVPCYLAIFALGEIFEILMALDALRLRNVIQLVGILVFHAALIVFSALQIHETKTALQVRPDTWQKVEPFLVVAPLIIAASWVALFFYVRALFSEFGWAIFHVVGANPQMKTMYQYYQIMVCLLKFDFFSFVGVTMQMLILVLATNTAEFGLTIAAVPIVLILLVACAIAVQREIKWLMTASLILMLGGMAYCLYKLVRFYQPNTEGEYVTTRATLTFFTIVAFVLVFATFAIGLRCFADFDKGLSYSKIHGHDVATRPRMKYSLTDEQKLASPAGDTASTTGGPTKERRGSYSGGVMLDNRISIE